MDESPLAGSDFQLGKWIVRPQRGCIESGNDSVRVKPKSMAVLERLALARGDVVSRNELFDTVWPGGAVTDDVLTHCIVELRKAFGDSARNAAVIETIPKSGFRLMLPVEPVTETAVADALPVGKRTHDRLLRTGLIAAAATVLGISIFWLMTPPGLIAADDADAAPSIAILSFVDSSPAGDQAWLADSLTEELTNNLIPVDDLVVISTSSALLFKDSSDSVQEIGAQLGVSHLVQGTVRKIDDRLRVTAQLVDADTARILWSNSYDRPREDIFRVQTEIVQAITGALSVRLGVGWLGTSEIMTRNVDAYEEAMQTYGVDAKSDKNGWSQRVQHLTRAVEIDPDFAWAWVQLAHHHRAGRFLFGEPYPWAEQAELALENAFLYAPNSYKTYLADAQLRVDLGDWAAAQRSLARAVELGAESLISTSHVQLDIQIKAGMISQAADSLEVLVRRDPLMGHNYMYLGHAYAAQGRLDDAFDAFERGLTRPVNPKISVDDALIVALASGDRDTQERWLTLAREAHTGRRDEDLMVTMAELFDDRESALIWLRHTYESSADDDYWVTIWAAYHGDVPLALEAMRRTPDGWSMWMPVMAGVRTHPEFKSIVRDLGLYDFWSEFGWGDLCRPIGDADFECS